MRRYSAASSGGKFDRVNVTVPPLYWLLADSIGNEDSHGLDSPAARDVLPGPAICSGWSWTPSPPSGLIAIPKTPLGEAREPVQHEIGGLPAVADDRHPLGRVGLSKDPPACDSGDSSRSNLSILKPWTASPCSWTPGI